MSALYKNLTGKKQSPATATKSLEEFFSLQGEPMYYILLIILVFISLIIIILELL